jgi:hypothetical protein
MNRIAILLSSLILFSVMPVTGQQPRHFGVKVALTSATHDLEFANGVSFDGQRRVGFNVGAFVEWFDHPFFSLVSQIEYAQRGMGFPVVEVDSMGNPLRELTFFSRLDYLSFPLLAKFRYPIGSLTPYLLVGPRLDILLSYQSDGNLFNSLYRGFSTTSVGGSAGIGVEVSKVFPTDIIAEVRYNRDLTVPYSTRYLSGGNSSYDFWLGVNF